MSLKQFEQYKNVTDMITKSVIEEHVSHAFIIEGDRGVDKMEFAIEMVKAMVCTELPGIGCDTCIACRKVAHGNYEDLYILEPESLSVKEHQIREMQGRLSAKPLGDKGNFAIIDRADVMTPQAQNSLLKTLEEPNPGTVIILLTENSDAFLPTVRSRCITYKLNSFDTGDAAMIEMASRVLEMIKNKALFIEIKELLDANIKTKDQALAFVDGMEWHLRNMLVDAGDHRYSKKNLIDWIEATEKAHFNLKRNGNRGYTIRSLILKIGG